MVASPSSRRAWIEMVRPPSTSPKIRVALLAEGVDRNVREMPHENLIADLSPSSRRAWIEIDLHPVRRRPSQVALLAEGVDRNSCTCAI